MSENTVLNPGYGGDVIAADEIDGIKYQRVKIVSGADGVNEGDVSSSNGLPVAPANITGKFRDAFESFTPGVNWNLTQDPADVVQLDGNAASASYLVISKDPFTPGTVTTLETVQSFDVPVEVAVGLSMSQRILGQELSVELVSTESPLPAAADIAIASISQSGTALTVDTSAPHGLVPGQRVGVYGVTSDSRLNYPSLVVATIPSSTRIVCNAGPMGNITSLTIGAVTDQGYVYLRSAMGYARNGLSEVFENTTTNNASVYVRSASGDVLPSATVNGNHTLTVSSTLGTQGVNAAYTYAWLPTTEYRFNLQADRILVYDVAVDSSGAQSARLTRTQVIPDFSQKYKLRFRLTNNKGLTVPGAKIVSASKSGSTTATITTATPHGLVAGDYVYLTGLRNGTDFPSSGGTAIQVVTVPSSTTFTAVVGTTSVTNTTYGGFIAEANGSNFPSAFAGAGVSAALQSVSIVNGELIAISSGSHAVLIGDYVHLYGVRNSPGGGDVGVDGMYKVVNVNTTTLTLAPMGGTTIPSSLASTNCGGAVIRRTDLRLSFARIFQYVRERVELLAQPMAGNAVQVNVLAGTVTTVSTVSNSFSAVNSLLADVTSAALTSTTTTSTITPTAGALAHEFNVIATAVAGTNPTLDVVVQESDDSGTNWYDTYHFPRITAAGQYRSPLIQYTGNRVRYVQTVGGISPSFTRSINRLQSHTSAPVQRQFFDRALAVNTLNSVTGSFFTEGCKTLNLFVNMGAVTTTAPVLVLEVSPDNANWVQIGADITTAASANNILAVTDTLSRFARVRVKSAGSGATLGFLMLKGAGL